MSYWLNSEAGGTHFMMENNNHQKKKPKKITITMPEEQYQQLEEKRKTHNMGKSNYIRYLIAHDDDTQYTVGMVSSLYEITDAVMNIKEGKNIEQIKSFIVDLEEGVSKLWQSLQ